MRLAGESGNVLEIKKKTVSNAQGAEVAIYNSRVSRLVPLLSCDLFQERVLDLFGMLVVQAFRSFEIDVFSKQANQQIEFRVETDHEEVDEAALAEIPGKTTVWRLCHEQCDPPFIAEVVLDSWQTELVVEWLSGFKEGITKEAR